MALTVEPPPSNIPAGLSRQHRLPEAGLASDTYPLQPQRVPKRARFTSPGPEAHVDTPPTVSTTLPCFQPPQLPTDLRLHHDTHTSTPPLPTASCDAEADQLRHLESLVDSVLATVVIIQAATTMPVTFSSHTKEAIQLLTKLMTSPIHPSTTSHAGPQPRMGHPTTPSYAQATTSGGTSPAAERKPKPHSAGQQPSHNHTHPRPPRLPHHSPYRLIIRWPGYPIPKTSDSLQGFVRCLEKEMNHLQSPKVELSGANVTRSGNIVVHTKAPQTTLQAKANIQENTSKLCNVVSKAGELIPGFDCPGRLKALPELELDVPWYGVVVHDIPAQPLLESYRGCKNTVGIWEAVEEQLGVPGTHIRDLRVLCRDENMEDKERLSIRIMLDDSRLCDHLTRDKAYLFGTQCRVSHYRPDRKRRRPPSLL